jgi:CHAT domain-containing protein
LTRCSEYFQQEDKLSPARALRAAQRWLRDTTNKEKAEYFRRYSPTLSGMRMLEATAVAFYNEAMSRDPDRRDFAHPFWWACGSPLFRPLVRN